MEAPPPAGASDCLTCFYLCRYWRFNEQSRSTDSDFPKPNSRWGRIPDSPKGAFLSDDSGKDLVGAPREVPRRCRG